jgi:hypothetical protein
MEGDLHPTKYFVLQANCPSLLIGRNETHTACRTLGMEFQENLSNGSRVTSEKIILHAEALHYRFSATKLTSFVEYRSAVIGVAFQKNPPIEIE